VEKQIGEHSHQTATDESIGEFGLAAVVHGCESQTLRKEEQCIQTFDWLVG